MRYAVSASAFPIPSWLIDFFMKNDDYVSKTDLVIKLECQRGIMTFSQREFLNDYLNDMIEEGIISQNGNMLNLASAKSKYSSLITASAI